MTAADPPRRFGRRAAHRSDEPMRRSFVTPEGLDLRLAVGGYGERVIAFAIDLMIIIAGLIGLSILVFLSAWGLHAEPSSEALAVIWVLGMFGLRYFYFLVFELRPGAATPGKRAMGLRVAARDGGRLTADAVFARNAMRELEVFLPMGYFLVFLVTRDQGEDIDGALVTLGVIWSGVFVLFPLFNRERLRLGDLAAGTMVVKAPKRLLRPDLARDGVATVEGVAFTEAQLDAYGEKELRVLEDVLRGGDRRTQAEVASRIRRKIAWEGPTLIADRLFLQAYYTALRSRLEARMLFGRRRRDKFDRS